MSDGTIEVRSESAVRVLAFARPEKKNALTQAMYIALNQALDDASADDGVRAVLLTGTNGVFTAGNDIGSFLEAPPVIDDTPVIQLLFRLADFQKPLLAAIDGPAIGIGTTLLLHVDDAIASTRARFQLPFANLGLVPEAGSSLLLPQLVGMKRASRWLLCGEPFDAAAALGAGLINEVVSPEELAAVALARAQRYAGQPPQALLESKRLLRGPQREQVKATIRAEVKQFAERLQSDEAREALMSFFTRKR